MLFNNFLILSLPVAAQGTKSPTAPKGTIKHVITILDPNFVLGDRLQIGGSVILHSFMDPRFLMLLRILDPQTWIQPLWEIARYDSLGGLPAWLC